MNFACTVYTPSCSTLPQMDPLDKFKQNQREGWAHFAPLEIMTTPTAAQLVRFARVRPGDGVLDSPDFNPPVVINESAVRRLGFASPQAAIGQTVLWPPLWDDTMRRPTETDFPRKPSRIIG